MKVAVVIFRVGWTGEQKALSVLSGRRTRCDGCVGSASPIFCTLNPRTHVPRSVHYRLFPRNHVNCFFLRRPVMDFVCSLHHGARGVAYPQGSIPPAPGEKTEFRTSWKLSVGENVSHLNVKAADCRLETQISRFYRSRTGR